MRREEQVRAVIVNGLRAGMTAKEIIQYHKLANTTVYVVKRKFDEFLAAGGSPESFNINRKKHKRRSDCKSAAIAEDVRNIVSRDPSKSMRAIAVEMKVHERTIRRTMKEELRYKSYAMRKGQFMSEATKNRRLHKAKKLLIRLKHPVAANQLVFFSDEKNFTQDQKVNRRNNRWLCSDPSEVPIVMATKFPAAVMVLGVISNEGDVMPPHIFPRGLKVNTDEYLAVMKEVVKPWMDQVAGGRHYVFQQDGAPAHNSGLTQQWLKENLPELWEKEIWPPSSPDCNPLDYFLWGVCEKEVNKAPHNTIASLVATIKQVMGNLDRDTVAKACRRFRSRIEAVVAANGDFIE
jgi:hypothetical protein